MSERMKQLWAEGKAKLNLSLTRCLENPRGGLELRWHFHWQCTWCSCLWGGTEPWVRWILLAKDRVKWSRFITWDLWADSTLCIMVNEHPVSERCMTASSTTCKCMSCQVVSGTVEKNKTKQDIGASGLEEEREVKGTEWKKVKTSQRIYMQATDNSVVKARVGGRWRPGWRWAEVGDMGNICNSVNN